MPAHREHCPPDQEGRRLLQRTSAPCLGVGPELGTLSDPSCNLKVPAGLIEGPPDLGELEQELTEVRRSLDQAGRDLEVARGVAERAELRADAEARRRGALQQSSSFLIGRAMLTMRRHPLRGSRQLLGAIRRSVRNRT